VTDLSDPAERPQRDAAVDAVVIGGSAELDAAFDEIAGLSETDLLTLIGSSAATPVEEQSAVLRMFGSEDLAARLETKGLITLSWDDLSAGSLVTRGQRVVERIIQDWPDELRNRICPLLRRGASEKELAASLVPILVAHFVLPHLVILSIALYISRYLAQKLCEGWQPASG
jgi:hypothetical protein